MYLCIINTTPKKLLLVSVWKKGYKEYLVSFVFENQKVGGGTGWSFNVKFSKRLTLSTDNFLFQVLSARTNIQGHFNFKKTIKKYSDCVQNLNSVKSPEYRLIK